MRGDGRKAKDPKKTLLRLLSYMKKHIPVLVLVLVCIFASCGGDEPVSQPEKESTSQIAQTVAEIIDDYVHLPGYGVRAYIVNKLLDVFNSRIMYYLTAIKSTFNFRFNEYFEEEIKDSNGILCLYNNCSGAEMKKIDLAIAFAILDIYTIQKQVNYNIIVSHNIFHFL